MKKYAPIVIAALLVLQVYTLFRLGDLQMELQNMSGQLTEMKSSLSARIAVLSTQLDTQSRAQVSILEGFEYSLGTLDPVRMTVPVTFMVTPKTSKLDTLATLYVGSDQVNMVRQGAAFTTTWPVGIFNAFAVKVVFKDGELERTAQLDVRDNLRQEVLPTVFAQFERQGGSSSYKRAAGAAIGEYWENGRMIVEAKPAVGNTIEKARLIITIAGKMVSEKPLATGSQGTEIDERLALGASQSVTLTVEATDKFGLRYQLVVDRFALDASGSPVGTDTVSAMGEATILDKDGNILYSPQK